MSVGYANFTLPSHLDPPVLDGQALHGIPVPIQRQPSQGANVLVTFNAETIVQLPFPAVDAEVARLHAWNFPLQAYNEADWGKLRRLAETARQVTFIDFDPLAEAFVAAEGATTFTLMRPTAESQYGPFPASTYPARAWLNQTEQTVVDTSPSSGEVQLVGSTVTTPALSANDELVIEYVPAFTVVVTPGEGEQLEVYGRIIRPYQLTETR